MGFFGGCRFSFGDLGDLEKGGVKFGCLLFDCVHSFLSKGVCSGRNIYILGIWVYIRRLTYSCDIVLLQHQQKRLYFYLFSKKFCCTRIGLENRRSYDLDGFCG